MFAACSLITSKFSFHHQKRSKSFQSTIAFHKYAELCNLKIIRKDIWLFQGIYIFHLDLNELVMYVIGSKLVFTLTMSMYTLTAGNTDSSPPALPLFKYTKFCNPRLLLRLTNYFIPSNLTVYLSRYIFVLYMKYISEIKLTLTVNKLCLHQLQLPTRTFQNYAELCKLETIYNISYYPRL